MPLYRASQKSSGLAVYLRIDPGTGLGAETARG